MVIEFLLDLSYIILAIGLAYSIDRYCPSYEAPDLSMPGGAAVFFGLFFLVGIGLTGLVGALPPVFIHAFMRSGWHLQLEKHASPFDIGVFGNLAQLVGGISALVILFRAWPLALAAYAGFFALSGIYNW